MKSILASLCIVSALGSCAVVKTKIYEEHPEQSAKAFELLESLAGTWKGHSMEGAAIGEPVEVSFEVIGGGTAVLQRDFPGTAQEALTMYYPNGPWLEMTHYANRSERSSMVCSTSNSESACGHWLFFSTRDDSDSAADAKSRVSAMNLYWGSKDQIDFNWVSSAPGKENQIVHYSLKRQKAETQRISSEF